MGVFVVMWFILMMMCIYEHTSQRNASRLFVCIVCMLVICLVQSLRDSTIGTDVINYINMFNNINWVDAEDVEPGYIFLNKVIYNFISEDEHVFLSIVSILVYTPFTIVAYKYSKLPALAFLILASFVIFIFTFSALRQSLAIAITTLSYIFVEKRKPIHFALLVLLASTFHSSAIVFAIVYPVCNYIKLTKFGYFILTVAVLIISFSLKSFLDSILPIIFSGEQLDRYTEYYSGSKAVPAYNLAILIFLFFLSTFLIKNPSKNDKSLQFLMFCSFCFQLTGLISPVVPRIGFYFFIFIGIALANVINYLENNSQWGGVCEVGTFLFMTWFFFSIYSNGYLNVMPYKFFFDF